MAENFPNLAKDINLYFKKLSKPQTGEIHLQICHSQTTEIQREWEQS